MVDLPTSVTLQLTETCNLRCRMCYAWGETGRYSSAEAKEKPATLDLGVVQRVIGELEPVKPSYSLFGGEPLIYPHLEELIRSIKAAGSFVDTPTNGTLLARHAEMLVRTGFDSVRVSLDGPRVVDDFQRGEGSYDRAIEGIEVLHEEKRKAGSLTPLTSIIYTVTPDNADTIEHFFLRDLNLDAIDWVTIQMQNFVTPEMGEAYAQLLRSEFGIRTEDWWRSLTRSPADFADLDTGELARQVQTVCAHLEERGKNALLLPPTFSPENLRAYLAADWTAMTDRYETCIVPWNAVDITATGDLAPCHVFYDFVVGNLYENSFTDLWNSETYRKFRAHMKREGLLSICPGCCILYLAN